MKIPNKPKDVAHVSDALWETALFAADHGWPMVVLGSQCMMNIIDHARCLILLGEVQEPVDPIEAATEAACLDYKSEKYLGKPGDVVFTLVCRKHFAGLTFPPVQP